MAFPSDTVAPNSSVSLLVLVRDFDRDAVACRKRITEILQGQPELFYQTAIEVLKKDTDSRGAQFLVTLLVSQNLLYRALSDPALDRERAMSLAQQALRIDPLVDVSLARQLADASVAATGADGIGTAERVVGILEKISDGQRILPSLMRMLRNNSPYLRSKAVLMIGRSGRSLVWIRKRLEEPDARVRANAAEALWGMEAPEARELLTLAVRDGNNRVVGNGLIGLYWLGDNSVLPELVRMAGSESVSYRRTAAWVMGETKDPRFAEVLGRMLSDSNGEVRKNGFTAIGKIRAAAALISQTAEWPVACAASPKDPRTGQRRVSVSVVSADGRESPRILPTQFLVSENGQPIWAYQVAERPAPEAMSVVFLYPRNADVGGKPWDQGALRCLGWKRSTDLWCALPYWAAAEKTAPADFDLPSFIANSAQAARAFQETPKRMDCTGFWTAVQRAVQPGNSPQRGRRHMIVLAPEDVGEPVDPKIVTAVLASRTSVQVVSAVPNHALREFCRRTNGQFQLVEDATAIEQRISLTYLNLLARYEIRYQSACPEGSILKLRVQTPAGWGETTIPVE